MNYYQILGVNKNASQKEIKEAYKKLVKKYHPDIYSGDKTFAETKIKEINSAYDILSNEETKKAYDEEINPTPIYNYTPPKYNNPESYSYHNYYRNVENDNNYRRYTDYHRSKTPNSNYHDQFSNTVIDSFNKISFKKKLLLIFLFVIIYFSFLIATFFKFNSFFDQNTTNTTSHHTQNEITNNTNTYESNFQEDFDINDYFEENELISIYNEYYKNKFKTYSEFREALEDSLYYYLYNE